MAFKIGRNTKIKLAYTLREILEQKYPELLERSEVYFNKYREFQDGELKTLLRDSELLKSLRSIIEFGNTVIFDKDGYDVHNNKRAWKIFIDSRINILKKRNILVDGSDTNMPDFTKIEYNDIAPYISRYENAQESKKEDVFNEFCRFMATKYFNRVFVSDFSASVVSKMENEYHKLYFLCIFSLVEELRVRLSQFCTQLAMALNHDKNYDEESLAEQLEKLLHDIDHFPLDKMMDGKSIDIFRLNDMRPIHDWSVLGDWTFRDIIGTINNKGLNDKLLCDVIGAPIPNASTLKTLVDDEEMVRIY